MQTKIIAKNKIYFKQIESTQKEAKKLAQRNVENGTMVITDYQTNGIGTHARKWYSEENKNLSFSIIIYPKCTFKTLKNFTVDIAKCIKEAIEDLYNITLDIKVPNDIFYRGKKIGGILTQIATQGEKIKYILIGIGININQEKFNKEIEDIATSLKKEFRREFSRQKILKEICYKFEKYCIEKNIITI